MSEPESVEVEEVREWREHFEERKELFSVEWYNAVTVLTSYFKVTASGRPCNPLQPSQYSELEMMVTAEVEKEP